MTQEEKFEEAKRLYETANADQRYVLESLFPELRDIENESIRKELLQIAKESEDSFYMVMTPNKREKLIAWLEKQGKETSWKPSKEEMDALYGLAYITNKMDDKKDEAVTKLYQDLKREFFNGSSYENMFPNTEDGVRRRSTIQVLEYARSLDTYNQYGKADIDKNIAWLEKQGEQKSAAWSEENEIKIKIIIALLKNPAVCSMDGNKGIIDASIKYLKSLKDRVQPQPKQEWSEEDKTIIDSLLDVLYRIKKGKEPQATTRLIEQHINFIESLKERYAWKPSDVQMIELRHVISGRSYNIERLIELEEQLKKLREEQL